MIKQFCKEFRYNCKKFRGLFDIYNINCYKFMSQKKYLKEIPGEDILISKFKFETNLPHPP